MLTAEQVELRRTGIGASEISAIAGINPWVGQHQVWMRKLGLDKEFTGNEHTERGTFLETAIARWVEHRTGIAVSHIGDEQVTVRHPEHRIVVATPDGIMRDGGVLEIKCPSFRTLHHWGAPETDEIPDYYLTQATWQMGATGRTHAVVARFAEGKLDLYRVEFSSDLFATLLEMAQEFWAKHVVTKEAPPVDGGDTCAAWLKARYPKASRAQLLPANVEADHWANEIRMAKAAIKIAEAAEQTARNKLESMIGEFEGLQGEWGKIYWRNNKPSKVVNWNELGKELSPTPDMLIRHSRVDWQSLCAEMKPADELVTRHTSEKIGPRPFRCFFKDEC